MTQIRRNDTRASTPRPRGRPRRFDLAVALEQARLLFHEHGVDNVSVAQLADEMGIAPPSFYKAFGSKAGLFAKVLERYEHEPLAVYAEVLRTAKGSADAVAAFVTTFTSFYTAEGQPPGCFVQEAARSIDLATRSLAEASASAAPALVARLLGEASGADDDIVDLVEVLMAGLSAQARRGRPRDRLCAAGRLAATLVGAELANRRSARS